MGYYTDLPRSSNKSGYSSTCVIDCGVYCSGTVKHTVTVVHVSLTVVYSVVVRGEFNKFVELGV